MAKTFMTNAEIMEKAQAEVAGVLSQIRADGTRTEAYKRQEIARAHRRMCEVRDRMVEARDAEKRTYQRELEGRIFGHDPSKGDAASWAISSRDAADRAANLDSPTDASYLLKQAERRQDEPLARAIAERAYEMGWAEVAETFLDPRPHLVQPLTDLWSQAKPSLQEEMMENFQLMAKPPELAGMDDHQIARLAEQSDADAAVSA